MNTEQLEKAIAFNDKQKSQNKRIYKRACVDTYEQELNEMRQEYPGLIDFYFCTHIGNWVLRTLDDDGGEEFETKSEMLNHLKETK